MGAVARSCCGPHRELAREYHVVGKLKPPHFRLAHFVFQSEYVASRVRKARDVVYTNAVEHICGPVIEDGDQCTAPVQLLSFSSVDRDVMKAVPFSCLRDSSPVRKDVCDLNPCPAIADFAIAIRNVSDLP